MLQDQVTHEHCPGLESKKVYRDTSTPESRQFWERLEERVDAHESRTCACSAFHSGWGARFGMLFQLLSMFPAKLNSRFAWLEFD